MSATKRTKSTRTKKAGTKKTKAGKVYIPPYKAIMLCLSVIVICVILLLVSTISKPKPKAQTPKEEPVQTSITERFETLEDKLQNEKTASPELPKKEEVKEIKQPEKKVEKEEKKSSTASDKLSNAKNSDTKQKDSSSENKDKLSATKDDTKQTRNEKKKATTFGFEKARNNAQLCFVFDDGGQNISHLKEFLTLPFPITVAVLPQITHSVEAADMVRKSGNELILHQPMQSINTSINPGPGAITPEMTDDQIIAQLFVNINQIGPVAGMNNHEGSGITADAEKMAVVLQMASDEGIYFLDSRTNVETQVPYVAGELCYSYFERNIFLDNEKTRANALAELKKGLALANKNGSVIMIGHVWSADFLPALLKEAYPELVEKGYTFSVVSTSKARKN